MYVYISTEYNIKLQDRTFIKFVIDQLPELQVSSLVIKYPNNFLILQLFYVSVPC